MKCILCWKRSWKYQHCEKCYDSFQGSNDYQLMVKKDTSRFIRQKFQIGNIRDNSLTCKLCNTTVRSKNRHDCVYCKCRTHAIDWGSWYAKVIFKDNKDDYELHTVMFDDIWTTVQEHTWEPIKLKKKKKAPL